MEATVTHIPSSRVVPVKPYKPTLTGSKLKHIDRPITMFAEELGGNANKRRQEEARARRRKIKEEQEQKKKSLERTTPTVQAQAATPATVPVVSSLPDQVAALETAAAGTKNAAVAVAMQQRQQRQQQ